jgi:iron complex outermembrane receptor protein
LGARYETQKVSADDRNAVDVRNVVKDNALSVSIGTIYTLTTHNVIAVNISRSARFASAEELFSFGPHLSTRTFENGNEQLSKETSSNIDISWRFENDYLNGELNLFSNEFKDFIFAANKLESDSCVSAQAAAEAAAESLQLICYVQDDTHFNGAEIQLDIPLKSEGAHQFGMAVFADYTRATFNNGGYVPRIPPVKIGFTLRYDFDAFTADVNWIHFKEQKNIADNELPTEGFNMLDLELAYRLPLAEDELFFFAKARNLLNEEGRDHSSFLKDLAPRATRGITLGARYTF